MENESVEKLKKINEELIDTIVRATKTISTLRYEIKCLEKAMGKRKKKIKKKALKIIRKDK